MAKINIRDSVLAELESRYPEGNHSDRILKLLGAVDICQAMGLAMPASEPSRLTPQPESSAVDDLLSSIL